RELVQEGRQREEVRLVVDVEAVVLERRGELYGLDEVARARAGEDGHAVRLRTEFVRQILPDAPGVAVETLARRRVRRVSARALRELLAQEAFEVLPPVLVGLRVQVKADERQLDRLELGEAVNSLLQSVALGCSALCHLFSTPLFGMFGDKFLVKESRGPEKRGPGRTTLRGNHQRGIVGESVDDIITRLFMFQQYRERGSEAVARPSGRA